jgi:hypothetical protein
MTHFDGNSILQQYLAAIRDAIQRGFAEYASLYGHVSVVHHPRSRATVIHDHIVARAKEIFDEFPGIHFLSGAPRNLFDVDGKIVLQFKKLRRTLLSSNYPTQLALAFERQQRVDGFPEIPPKLPRLAAGYVPSRDFTSIDGIYVTFAEGKRLKWFLDITNEGDQALPFQLPETPPQDAPTKRAQPKRAERPGSDSSAADQS